MCLLIILNFYFTINTTFMFILSLQLVMWYNYAATTHINLVDILSRIDSNEFFINTYYYLWTSFWYIPTLLVCIVLLNGEFVLTNTSTIRWYYLYAVLLLTMVVFELSDYWHLNTHHILFIGDASAVNPLLTNSINKYHPLLFYVSLLGIVLSCTYFTELTRYTSTRFGASNISRHIIYGTNQYLIYSITTTLFWGSWWALQEGSWGGWWNWDPSEVFGLVVMLCILTLSHTPQSYNHSYTFLTRLLTQVTLLLSLYLFIQLNFSLVSHNFGINSTQFVNPIQWFSILATITVVFLSYVIYVCTRTWGYNMGYLRLRTLGTVSTKGVISAFLGCLLVVEVVYSFYPLINDFLWNLLSLNTLNNSLSIRLVVTYILTILFISVWRPINLLYITVYLYTTSYYILLLPILLILFIPSIADVALSHYLTVVFVYTTLLYAQSNSLYWDLESSLHSFIGVEDPLQAGLNTLTNVSNVIGSEALILINNSIDSLVNFGLFNTSTTSENPIFALATGWVDSWQLLIDGLFTTSFMINVVDYGITQLASLFVLVATLTYSWLNRRENIMY